PGWRAGDRCRCGSAVDRHHARAQVVRRGADLPGPGARRRLSGPGLSLLWIFLSRGLSGIALRYGVTGRAAMVIFLFIGAHFSVIGAAWGATAGSILLWFLYTAFAVPRAGIRIGSITVDSLRVLAL